MIVEREAFMLAELLVLAGVVELVTESKFELYLLRLDSTTAGIVFDCLYC